MAAEVLDDICCWLPKVFLDGYLFDTVLVFPMILVRTQEKEERQNKF